MLSIYYTGYMYNGVVVLGSSILLAYIEQTKVRVCGYGRCLSTVHAILFIIIITQLRYDYDYNYQYYT